MSVLVPYVIEKSGREERAMDIYSRLLKDRIVILGSQINDVVANSIVAQLLYLQFEDGKADIHLYINSPGGSITAGLAIYDTMQYITCDVATYCVGQAASMGAILLTAGAAGKRNALPNSRIMIHQPLSGMEGTAADPGHSRQGSPADQAADERDPDQTHRPVAGADSGRHRSRQLHAVGRGQGLRTDRSHSGEDAGPAGVTGRRRHVRVRMNSWRRRTNVPPVLRRIGGLTDGVPRSHGCRMLGAAPWRPAAPRTGSSTFSRAACGSRKTRSTSSSPSFRPSQSQLQAARRETVDLKTQLADGNPDGPCRAGKRLGQVEGIALNKFLTGGLDRDGMPGDEIFSAVIVPTDSQGNLVKAPGSVVADGVRPLQARVAAARRPLGVLAPGERVAVAQRVPGERLCRPRPLAIAAAVARTCWSTPA